MLDGGQGDTGDDWGHFEPEDFGFIFDDGEDGEESAEDGGAQMDFYVGVVLGGDFYFLGSHGVGGEQVVFGSVAVHGDDFGEQGIDVYGGGGVVDDVQDEGELQVGAAEFEVFHSIERGGDVAACGEVVIDAEEFFSG